jgi:hypothetical protein
MIMSVMIETNSAFCSGVKGVVFGAVSLSSGSGGRPGPRRWVSRWSTSSFVGGLDLGHVAGTESRPAGPGLMSWNIELTGVRAGIS